MGKDITTTAILSTCAHCGETVEHVSNTRFGRSVWATLDKGEVICAADTLHTVDLSHAFSHMTPQG